MMRAHGESPLHFVFALAVAALVIGCSVTDPVTLTGRPDIGPEGTPDALPATDGPPPISGGSLLVTPGGIAVAADSDRDLVWLVDLETHAFSKVVLNAHDEPGRVIVDAAGRAHVALRRGGAVATIDVPSASVLRRVPVCPAPRGIAYDATLDALHVACTGGEVVTLDAGSGAVLRSVRLPYRDLRDVVVRGAELVVSRFRSAEVLLVSATETHPDKLVLARNLMPARVTGAPEASFTATVAWRMISQPDGGLLLLHQQSMATSVPNDTEGSGQSGGYSGEHAAELPCRGVVNSTVTALNDDGSSRVDQAMPALRGAAVAVDIAIDEDGAIVVASPGTSTVLLSYRDALDEPPDELGCQDGTYSVWVPGEPIAVARWKGSDFVQTREPAALLRINWSKFGTGPEVDDGILLPGDSMANEGHAIFHDAVAGLSPIACASCHPEGGDDGHVWTFLPTGARRTQTVAGGVLSTGPFHWDGILLDFPTLVDVVYRGRMGGSSLDESKLEAFSAWIQGIPAPLSSPRGSAAEIARGAQLFEITGCSACHSGPHLTNDHTVDVGTGASFQVPSLIGISARAPYFHDGCAASLHARFDLTQPACNGGDAHGTVSPLSEGAVDDLVAYLETL